MNKTTFHFLIGLLISPAISGQWIQQNSGTSNYLYDVHFPTRDTGYVVGAYGTVLKTTDGGINWASLNTGNTYTLRTTYFFDSNVGIIAGDSSVFMKTVDGGLNWSNITVPLPVPAVIYDIHFPTLNIGYAIGNNATLKTIDGGDSWDTMATSIYSHSIFCISSDTCFTIPWDLGWVNVYRTTDGNNWYATDSVRGQDFECIFFTNSNTGYITGWYSNPTYKTIDGGDTWQTLILEKDLYDLNFPSINTGYGVGWRGTIVKTTDGGANWTKQAVPVPDSTIDFYSVHFIDNYTGYAVGSYGTIFRTISGGETGINENEKINFWTLYPNPFSNSTIIEFENKKREKHTLTFYNITGQLVRQINNINEGQVKIEKKNLTSGLYFFQLRNDVEIVGTGKIIIE